MQPINSWYLIINVIHFQQILRHLLYGKRRHILIPLMFAKSSCSVILCGRIIRSCTVDVIKVISRPISDHILYCTVITLQAVRPPDVVYTLFKIRNVAGGRLLRMTSLYTILYYTHNWGIKLYVIWQPPLKKWSSSTKRFSFWIVSRISDIRFTSQRVLFANVAKIILCTYYTSVRY